MKKKTETQKEVKEENKHDEQHVKMLGTVRVVAPDNWYITKSREQVLKATIASFEHSFKRKVFCVYVRMDAFDNSKLYSISLVFDRYQ